MKPLLLLMLFSITAYSAPPDHANNPDADEMPEQAECAFCDEEPAPMPQGLWWFAAGVLFMKLYNAKSKSDEHLLNP